MKLWNFEDFLFQFRQSPYPSTYRLPPLHQPPSWGTPGNLGDTIGVGMFKVRTNILGEHSFLEHCQITKKSEDAQTSLTFLALAAELVP